VVSPPPRSSSLLSPVGSPSAAAALQRQGSGQAHTHRQQSMAVAVPAALSLSGAPLAKHNSLPPLRGMSGGGCAEVMPSASASAGSLAPGPESAGQAGMATSMSSSSLAPLGAGSRSGSCSMVHRDSLAGQPAVTPPTVKAGLFRQHSGCMCQSFGQGRGAAAAGGPDSAAFCQLQAVCNAQVELYRYVPPCLDRCALPALPDCHKASGRCCRGTCCLQLSVRASQDSWLQKRMLIPCLLGYPWVRAHVWLCLRCSQVSGSAHQGCLCGTDGA
jgi:hypothetical protein